MAEFFGFEINRKKENIKTVVEPATDDGTFDAVSGGFYSSIMDLDGLHEQKTT